MRLADQAHPGIAESSHVGPGSVGGGGVVDDDHVEIGVVHGQDGFERDAQHGGPIAGAHDDRDGDGVVFTGLGCGRTGGSGPQAVDPCGEFGELDLAFGDGDFDDSERPGCAAHQQLRASVAGSRLQPAADRRPLGRDVVQPDFTDPKGASPAGCAPAGQHRTEPQFGCRCARHAAAPDSRRPTFARR